MNYIYMYININNVDTVVTQDIEREAELDRLMLHAPVRKTKQKRGIYGMPWSHVGNRYTYYM